METGSGDAVPWTDTSMPLTSSERVCQAHSPYVTQQRPTSKGLSRRLPSPLPPPPSPLFTLMPVVSVSPLATHPPRYRHCPLAFAVNLMEDGMQNSCPSLRKCSMRPCPMLNRLGWQVRVQCCFTSTETIRTIRDGEPRTATLTFTQHLGSDGLQFVSVLLYDQRDHIKDYLGREAQDSHLDFHTAPELRWMASKHGA